MAYGESYCADVSNLKISAQALPTGIENTETGLRFLHTFLFL